MADQTFTAPPTVVSRQVGGEMVLVDLNSEQYFSLNQTGSVIWTALAAGQSVTAAGADLLATFDVPAETAAADVDALVQELVAAGLLHPAG